MQLGPIRRRPFFLATTSTSSSLACSSGVPSSLKPDVSTLPSGYRQRRLLPAPAVPAARQPSPAPGPAARLFPARKCKPAARRFPLFPYAPGRFHPCNQSPATTPAACVRGGPDSGKRPQLPGGSRLLKRQHSSRLPGQMD